MTKTLSGTMVGASNDPITCVLDLFAGGFFQTQTAVVNGAFSLPLTDNVTYEMFVESFTPAFAYPDQWIGGATHATVTMDVDRSIDIANFRVRSAPASTYQPATAMVRAIVEKLRADSGLQDLLFGTAWPSRATDDHRVWSMDADLPEGTTLRDPVPLVLIEAGQYPMPREQVAEVLEGEVTITTHSQAPRQYEATAERIDAYVERLLVSTQWSDARMIAAALVPDGLRERRRVSSLDDAWDILNRFRSPSVGVLQ